MIKHAKELGFDRNSDKGVDFLAKFHDPPCQRLLKSQEKVKQLFDKKYIYESPDAGKTITRRKFGDYDNKETLNN